MKKAHIMIVIVVVLVVVIGGAWIITSQLHKGKQWVSVGRWIGSQTDYNMTTEQFVITGDEWQIQWGCNGIRAGSRFDILVYDVYTGNVTKEIEPQETSETFSGISYLNAKGRFYLQIFILGDLKDWAVSVGEYK